MLYALVNGALPEKANRTITISITPDTLESFVVTDSSNTFDKYEVKTSGLTPVDLKYPCEVVGKILGKNYPKDDSAVILIEDDAMDFVHNICEINRRFF